MCSHMLTGITFLPLLGAVLLGLLIPRKNENAIKWFALAISVVTMVGAIPLFTQFINDGGMQFTESIPWINYRGQVVSHYSLGVDGLSLFLILLTVFLSAISILASWTAITDKVKEYYIFLLVLETGMLGVFVATDMLLFYMFWEAMLIPM